jgi:hypothetical protein
MNERVQMYLGKVGLSMNRFSRNLRLLHKFLVTNSYIGFHKNSTNGLLAANDRRTDRREDVVSIQGVTCTSQKKKLKKETVHRFRSDMCTVT